MPLPSCGHALGAFDLLRVSGPPHQTFHALGEARAIECMRSGNGSGAACFRALEVSRIMRFDVVAACMQLEYEYPCDARAPRAARSCAPYSRQKGKENTTDHSAAFGGLMIGDGDQRTRQWQQKGTAPRDGF